MDTETTDTRKTQPNLQRSWTMPSSQLLSAYCYSVCQSQCTAAEAQRQRGGGRASGQLQSQRRVTTHDSTLSTWGWLAAAAYHPRPDRVTATSLPPIRQCTHWMRPTGRPGRRWAHRGALPPSLRDGARAVQVKQDRLELPQWPAKMDWMPVDGTEWTYAVTDSLIGPTSWEMTDVVPYR